MSRPLVAGSLIVFVAGCRPSAQPPATGTAVEAGLAVQESKPPLPAEMRAPPLDVKKTRDGLVYKVLARGRGITHPGANDLVTVKTIAWKTDGQPLLRADGTQGGEATIRLASLGPSLSAGIRTMVRGEKRRFWMSEEQAAVVRTNGVPGQIVVDVELLAFKAGPRPPPAPSDLRSPPRGRTSKVLRNGAGTTSPRPDDIVELQYAAWSANGKLIHDPAQPFRGPMANLAPALRAAVQAMVEGEKRRLWVREGVIDVELIRILERSGPAVVAASPDIVPAPASR